MRPFENNGTAVLLALAILAVSAPATAEEIALRQIARDGYGAVEASDTCGASCGDRCSYDAQRLLDGRLWSAWAATKDSAAPSVRLDLGATRYLVRLDIVVGDARNRETFARSTRPTRLELRAGDERREIELSDSNRTQALRLDPPLVTSELELSLVGAVGGRSSRCGVALSELTLWEPVDVLSLRPELREQIERHLAQLVARGADAPEAERALVEIGPPAATSVLLALRGAPAERTLPLARVLAAIGDTRGAAALSDRLARASGVERYDLLAALAAAPTSAAASHLIAAAQSGPSDERLLALTGLAGIEGGEVGEALAAVMLDRDPFIAEAAAKSLCGRSIDALGPAIERLPAATADVQRVAARCLPAILEGPARETLHAFALRSDAAPVRAALLSRTCTRGDATGDRAARALTTHRDPSVRADALTCLSRTGADDEVFLTAAVSGEPLVERVAIAELVRRGPESLAPLSMRVLDAAPRSVDRQSAALSVLPAERRTRAALLWGRYGKPAWAPAAGRLLGPPSVDALRSALAQADGQRPCLAALKRLVATDAAWRTPAVELVRSGHWQTHPAALDVFAEVAQAEDVDALRDALATADPRVLTRAAAALGELGGPDAVTLLLPLTQPTAPDSARAAAARALGETGDTSAVEPLQRLAATRPAAVSAAAVAALGRLQGAAALDTLEEAFRSDDYDTRRAALVTCCTIRHPRALALLGRAAADSDPAIRELGLTLLAQK